MVPVLSRLGPWKPAAGGIASHVALDCLTGGVYLLVPFATGRYGLDLNGVYTNVLVTVVSVTAVLAGPVRLKYDVDVRPVTLRFRDRLGHRFW